MATTASARLPWRTARRRATSDEHGHPDHSPAETTAVSTELDLGLLRVTTAGSVDDGKSTLIGRLLLDSKAIFEDQLEAVEATSKAKGHDHTDLALLTDGLRSEREQGITIDVAYRYFATPRRKFILADTPGHAQYTRNMVTGASTADLGLVLVDARHGITEQSRRHTVLLSLLRVPHITLVVNKMDLVGYDEAVFTAIRDEFVAFTERLEVPEISAFPISALVGDNVVETSDAMPWYTGTSLLDHPSPRRTLTSSRPRVTASRSSTSSARSRASTATTVATPAASSPVRSPSVRKSSSSPAVCAAPWRASTPWRRLMSTP